MRADIARATADVLVTADLLGHTTHGLALLAPYLAEIEKGSDDEDRASRRSSMRARRARRGTASRLPGTWLTLRALDRAAAMAKTNGTGTVVIRRSHHIACLAVYLLRATERGLVAIVQSSDPTVFAVVPHGGITPVITPNPIAAGLPTSGDPILIDISSSITSMGFAFQQKSAGKKLPGAWLIDNQGNATDDPAALSTDPRGALLPLGGLDAGYKGFGLTLLVEALTAGLSGFGRADPPEGWGGTVFVQVFDPEAFGGIAAFRRQMDHMVDITHASKPRPGVERVRLPGEAGMRRLREQRANGVALYPTIMPALEPWAEKLGVALPAAGARFALIARHAPSSSIATRDDARDAGEILRRDDFREARRREQLAHPLRLIVAVLDDKRAAGREMRARAVDDSPDRRKSVDSGRERRRGLEANVAVAQMRIVHRDVRRIARDQVERGVAPCGRQIREPVRSRELDVGDAEPPRIVLRDGERFDRDVGREHLRARPLARERERDRAGSGAEVEHRKLPIGRQP